MEYIICRSCDAHNRDGENYCQACGNKLKKRRWPILVFLLLILYPLIINFQVSWKTSEYADLQKPTHIIREVTEQVPIKKEVCENLTYRFSTLGGDVISIGKFVQPNLDILNIEDRWGYYKVNISYMDEEKYPYEKYGGNNLKEKTASGEISVADADFYSEDYAFYIGPGEWYSVTNRTEKKDPGKTYWAIATIIEPSYVICQIKTEYVNTSINKTFTEYRYVREKTDVIKKMAVADILGIGKFIYWFLIILALFGIIHLSMKIKDERIKRNILENNAKRYPGKEEDIEVSGKNIPDNNSDSTQLKN